MCFIFMLHGRHSENLSGIPNLISVMKLFDMLILISFMCELVRGLASAFLQL